jgi:hypothetical protein
LRLSLVLALSAATLAGALLAACGGRSRSSMGSPAVSDETVSSITPAAGSDTAKSASDATPAPSAAQVGSRAAFRAAKPVDTYVLLGGRIKSCWFNAEKPLLPGYVYRADVSPDGNKVQIMVHKARELGRAGVATYAIDFHQEGAYTIVTTRNGKMPPELDAKMRYDIQRWKGGDTSCNDVMPKVAAKPPAR